MGENLTIPDYLAPTYPQFAYLASRPKKAPMTRHRSYYPMNPHPGISPANLSFTGYWHASPTVVDDLPLIPNSEFLIPNWSFTFSAKEKDVETGLSYFGSRYYSSDLSIWLSVDPMSDKYASLSPYVYCANNPVKLVAEWGGF